MSFGCMGGSLAASTSAVGVSLSSLRRAVRAPADYPFRPEEILQGVHELVAAASVETKL